MFSVLSRRPKASISQRKLNPDPDGEAHETSATYSSRMATTIEGLMANLARRAAASSKGPFTISDGMQFERSFAEELARRLGLKKGDSSMVLKLIHDELVVFAGTPQSRSWGSYQCTPTGIVVTPAKYVPGGMELRLSGVPPIDRATVSITRLPSRLA